MLLLSSKKSEMAGNTDSAVNTGGLPLDFAVFETSL